MGRMIMSQWLKKNDVLTWEASEWNELTHILQELFQDRSYKQYPFLEFLKQEPHVQQEMEDSIFIIVVDIGLLDLNTDIWKDQLNFLDKYRKKAKFDWVLNHDTSNIIKIELRNKGHVLMVNKPFYKGKMVQILEGVIEERNLDIQKRTDLAKFKVGDSDVHECLDIDSIQYGFASSDNSEKSEIVSSNYMTKSLPRLYLLEDEFMGDDPRKKESQRRVGSVLDEAVPGKRSLEGVRILLAEDTPLLQKVSTIMLERLGASVVAAGDRKQAVDALNILDDDNNGITETDIDECSPYDLVLMDCQMPKMDGYDATKAIRRLEQGTGKHIPIVALTAHAMSCDEAKCLEVGMDAYLTKPIDRKLMVSTIISLTTHAS